MIEWEVFILLIGVVVLDFNFFGVDGKYYSLVDFVEVKVLLIFFICNYCLIV